MSCNYYNTKPNQSMKVNVTLIEQWRIYKTCFLN